MCGCIVIEASCPEVRANIHGQQKDVCPSENSTVKIITILILPEAKRKIERQCGAFDIYKLSGDFEGLVNSYADLGQRWDYQIFSNCVFKSPFQLGGDSSRGEYRQV